MRKIRFFMNLPMPLKICCIILFAFSQFFVQYRRMVLGGFSGFLPILTVLLATGVLLLISFSFKFLHILQEFLHADWPMMSIWQNDSNTFVSAINLHSFGSLSSQPLVLSADWWMPKK